MPASLRMRVFAGPNGSGKSTMYRHVRNAKVNGRNIDFGVYVNPDEVAKAFREEGAIDLNSLFQIESGRADFERYLPNTTLIPTKISLKEVSKAVEWSGSRISLTDRRNVDRIAQLVTQFICDELLRNKRKFSFETVFSDTSKLKIMDRANDLGYKTYLYFISTGHPEINRERVKFRVEQGGHDVPSKTIWDRYFRSLGLLEPAIKRAYHAFVYDNTEESVMFAEYKIHKAGPFWHFYWADIPDWFIKYYMDRCGSQDIEDAAKFALHARILGVGRNPDRGGLGHR